MAPMLTQTKTNRAKKRSVRTKIRIAMSGKPDRIAQRRIERKSIRD